MRVLRAIFFLGTIAILMPSPPEQAQRGSLMSSVNQVTAPQFIHAASRTVSDVGEFCGRQAMVCETAGFIASKLEAKAKYGVKLIYEWANEASGSPGAGQAFEESLSTASLTHVAADATLKSQNTLRVEDLIPVWRNPLPAKKS
jgi:hypothetical protein